MSLESFSIMLFVVENGIIKIARSIEMSDLSFERANYSGLHLPMLTCYYDTAVVTFAATTTATTNVVVAATTTITTYYYNCFYC